MITSDITAWTPPDYTAIVQQVKGERKKLIDADTENNWNDWDIPRKIILPVLGKGLLRVAPGERWSAHTVFENIRPVFRDALYDRDALALPECEDGCAFLSIVDQPTVSSHQVDLPLEPHRQEQLHSSLPACTPAGGDKSQDDFVDPKVVSSVQAAAIGSDGTTDVKAVPSPTADGSLMGDAALEEKLGYDSSGDHIDLQSLLDEGCSKDKQDDLNKRSPPVKRPAPLLNESSLKQVNKQKKARQGKGNAGVATCTSNGKEVPSQACQKESTKSTDSTKGSSKTKGMSKKFSRSENLEIVNDAASQSQAHPAKKRPSSGYLPTTPTPKVRPSWTWQSQNYIDTMARKRKEFEEGSMMTQERQRKPPKRYDDD